MDGIPLLLDCSTIDGKNPYMLQWVTFAVRNLCDGNAKNQSVVAGIDGPGVAVRTLSDEFGMQVGKP